MENKFLGVPATKVSGVYVRGITTVVPCSPGSFHFQPEEGEFENVSGGDGNAYAIWRDQTGKHRVLADEVIGVRSED